MQGIGVLGWREWVALPVLGMPAVCAKIDTGARSSALHVDWQECLRRDGVEWVRFGLHPGLWSTQTLAAEAPILDRRGVTDSGGHMSERVFIRTPVTLGAQTWTIEVNLTCRHRMRFPMLLGRTALVGRFMVDPAASWLLGNRA